MYTVTCTTDENKSWGLVFFVLHFYRVELKFIFMSINFFGFKLGFINGGREMSRTTSTPHISALRLCQLRFRLQPCTFKSQIFIVLNMFVKTVKKLMIKSYKIFTHCKKVGRPQSSASYFITLCQGHFNNKLRYWSINVTGGTDNRHWRA